MVQRKRPGPSIVLNVRVSPDLREQLAQVARAEDRSISGVIRRAVIRDLAAAI